jgi:hypothetical protein
VDDTGKQEEEGSSHQRKKVDQKKKKQARKHLGHESDENSEKEKKTT